MQRPRGALRSLQEAEATPRAPMSRASLEGTGWGQGKVAGTIWQWGVGVALASGWAPGDAGAPSLRPHLLPDGHWASARHSAPGLIPKQNIWFPGLMALKCKYCFSVSNKQSHTGSRSPELATRRPPALVRARRSGPSAPNTLEWGRGPPSLVLWIRTHLRVMELLGLAAPALLTALLEGGGWGAHTFFRL